jgi:hypothetical protein
MISIDAGRRSALAAEYTRLGYAVIPRLVDPEVAAAWELKHRSLPARRVHVDHERQATWLEQRFRDPAQALDGLAFADGFIDRVAGIAGLDAIDRNRTEIWINRYRPGDRVPTHCDGAGSAQLVLCLQGLLEPEKGGDLVIRDEVVPLRTGNAVLFFAHGLLHGIPLIESAKVGSSGFARVTCTIRFHTPNGPGGASS